MDRLNVNGGSIAIGHPFGMTGSRLVGTIANEMLRRKARYGVVTMCVGGGQGAAALFERACRPGRTRDLAEACHGAAVCPPPLCRRRHTGGLLRAHP